MLKTAIKTSAKTKVLMGAALLGIAAAAYGMSVMQSASPAIKLTPERIEQIRATTARNQALWEKESRLDTKAVAAGGRTATQEVERWLNAHVGRAWTKEGAKYDAANDIETGICKWINEGLAKSEYIYGCSKGSEATVSLGSDTPRVTVSAVTADMKDLASKRVIHYTIAFTTKMKSDDASIEIILKCKGKWGTDRVCPDPKAAGTVFGFDLAKTTVVIDVAQPSGEMTVNDKSLVMGKVTASVPLTQACFDIVIAGKKCFDLGADLGPNFAGPLGDVISEKIKGI